MLYMGAVTLDNLTTTGGDLVTTCEGYGGLDNANISNAAVLQFFCRHLGLSSDAYVSRSIAVCSWVHRSVQMAVTRGCRQIIRRGRNVCLGVRAEPGLVCSALTFHSTGRWI
jgi:hypothetical protein